MTLLNSTVIKCDELYNYNDLKNPEKLCYISSNIECSRFCQSEMNLCLVIIVNISKREKMTCMSMYKTTKIVPVKVVRLIEFYFFTLVAGFQCRSIARSS